MKNNVTLRFTNHWDALLATPLCVAVYRIEWLLSYGTYVCIARRLELNFNINVNINVNICFKVFGLNVR